MLGLDGSYFDDLWNRYLSNPEALTPDWRNALDFVREVYGDPHSSLRTNPATPRDALIVYLRRFGHLHARLDPLGIVKVPPLPSNLLPTAADVGALVGTYSGALAVETGHIDDPKICEWVAAEFEATHRRPAAGGREILWQLIGGEMFDRFMAVKYPGKKRFGSEGADTMLPLLFALRAQAAETGVDEIVLGSMHRGRLSMLHHFLGMDAAQMFAQFGGAHPFGDDSDLPADVAYHFGHCDTRNGVRTTLLPNPSHLEAVNPVAVGYARARRTEGSGNAMAVVVHTDASVVGQGVNAELLQMSALPGFTVGGTVHVVINNQIGFTTNPNEARSSRYCTGPWRAVDSLLLHVNGDDVEAVMHAASLATRFRDRFRRDAVIDLVCYRKNGHNEIDEPRFTQPLYYRAADRKRSIAELYEARLVEAGIVGADQVDAHRKQVAADLDAAFAARRSRTKATADPVWPAMPEAARLGETELRHIVEKLAHVPGNTGAPKMVRLMERRLEELETGIGWPLAEAMAFAATLQDGISVRLCGQDVERGAFSQRHLAAIDPETGARTHPIASLARQGATMEVVNSPLSEYAVLGFEYGYSLGSAGALCVWEAQFGDFANGAQIMIDQFIASAREKWLQASNLTLLLPHGLEGQGPEHSSARIERLLQLCARDNIRIAHPSTPANYYHLLRQQALTVDRPLFVITPKVLLRLPKARSALADFCDDAGFRSVLASIPAGARRGILCSGKIAYELEKLRDERKVEVGIIRLESLYPFPSDELTHVLGNSNLTELAWLQEEPGNFGAAQWLRPKLERLAVTGTLRLLPAIARVESASPAGSFHGWHGRDQDDLLKRALGMSDDDGR